MIKSGIKYPEMRAELLSYISDLSDFLYQKTYWNSEGKIQALKKTGKEHGFDFSVHFLYDDTSLADDAEGCIGSFLKDKDEAKAIKKVVDSLDIIFDKYGLDLSDEKYILKPEWNEVLESAKDALKVLQKNEGCGDGIDTTVRLPNKA